MRHFSALAIACCCALFSFAQTSIQGVINDYTVLTSVASCPLEITVLNASAFAAGDLILVYQATGASINTSNTVSYGDIAAYGSTGLLEQAIVDSVSGSSLWLESALVNSYDVSQTQVIRVPHYAGATVDSTLIPQAWNGSTGGIVALSVTGTITLNADIDASGMGFEGAPYVNSNNNGCLFFSSYSDYYYAVGDWRSSPKGYGIADIATGFEAGRGKQANGGGGANDHNAGGGGGGNYGAGGLGGENDDPGQFNCHGFYPGEGGLGLTNANRLFFGGGGGCGHGNNNLGSAGANGGGMIIVIADTIETNGGMVLANGLDAANGAGDGAGGGGAGGVIMLDVQAVPSMLIAETSGGDGGSTNNSSTPRCMGPGGGGGGGRIYHTGGANVSTSVAPGLPGVVMNSSVGCNGQSLGAAFGGAGQVYSSVSITQGSSVPSVTISGSLPTIDECPGMGANFGISVSGNDYSLQWEINTGSGWQALADTGAFSGTTDSLLSISALALWMDSSWYRLVASAACGSTEYSDSGLIIMQPPPILAWPPTSTVVCEGALGAIPFVATGTITGYQWQQNTDSGWVDLSNGGGISGVDGENLFVNPAPLSLDSTEFRCEITGCGQVVHTDAVFLNVLPLPVPSATFTVDSNLATFASTSTFTDSATWNFGDGSTGGPANNLAHPYDSNGTYNIVLTAWNGCGSSDTAFPIMITGIDTLPPDTMPPDTNPPDTNPPDTNPPDTNGGDTTGIYGAYPDLVQLSLYPNPARHQLFVETSAALHEPLFAVIFDAVGRQLWRGRLTPLGDGRFAVDIGRLSEGAYFLKTDGSRALPFTVLR